MSEHNYFMVRARDSTEEIFSLLQKNSSVAIGWSRVRFCDYQLDYIVDEIAKEYYSHTNKAPQVIGKKLNEVKRFKSIKAGDIIIVPHYNRVWIAKATDEEFYDENAKTLDLSNQIKVDYYCKDNEIISISRYDLSEGLQRRLRVRGSTVSNLAEFQDEIEKICSEIEKNQFYTYDSGFAEKIEEKEKIFKEELLKNIQNGNTYIKAGGIGLEELVKELFECEGFTAEIWDKRSTPGTGDIDVQATITYRLFDTEIENIFLAQVKHHSGESGETGVMQLLEAKKAIQEKFFNATYVFVTSGLIRE